MQDQTAVGTIRVHTIVQNRSVNIVFSSLQGNHERTKKKAYLSVFAWQYPMLWVSNVCMHSSLELPPFEEAVNTFLGAIVARASNPTASTLEIL